MTSDKREPIPRTRVVLSQVSACITLDFLLIGLGMSISFVTMVLPEVLHAKEGLSINEEQASWFEYLTLCWYTTRRHPVGDVYQRYKADIFSMFFFTGSMAFLCQPFGSIFSGPLLDTFGRKKALFLVNIPHLFAWILMYSAWNVPSLFVANALLGIGTGIMEAPSVTYVGEVSDKGMRGILTTLTNGFTATGLFISYFLGTVLPWRQAALVSLAVPLTTMLLVLFVPETPIWLLSQGRQNEALQSLCRLRGWAQPEDVQEEFTELVEYNHYIHQCVLCIKENNAVEPCLHSNGSLLKRIGWKFKNIFFVKETMRPFILVMTYFFFHIMSGFAPVRSNMVNMCKALGMKYDSKTIVVIVGGIQIVASILSASLVKLFGKRKVIINCLLASAACCVGISIYAAANIASTVRSYQPETFPDQKEILPVLLFLLLVCFYGLGLPWILLSEVFPFRSRGMATGLAAALSYTIFFFATKTNINLDETFHISGTYAIYACFGFFGAIYLYFFLPETESKSLLEIEAYYKGDQLIFADDCFINMFRKKNSRNIDVSKPMLVNNKRV